MENAVEALKTAAAVLVFIIALTVAFTMFSKAKITTDAIVTMQDKQEYLEAASVDGGILYTSKDAIDDEVAVGSIESKIPGMTTKGDRIVSVDDVISTIYRYNVEKYGVTIIKSNGDVLARFDSNTENIVRQWYNIQPIRDNYNHIIKTADAIKEDYVKKIKENLTNTYVTNINLNKSNLENLYSIDVKGSDNKIKCGAPWYGNPTEIISRCNADIAGAQYTIYGDNITYQGKGVKAEITGKTIVEVINEIDNSAYLDDSGKTDLLQQYQLPTTEIIYILK